MEAVHQSLSDTAIAQYQTLNATNPNSRLLIALAGPPGSGKTTSAIAIAALINSKLKSTSTTIMAMVVSMDGYHYPRSYLDKLPNREEAYIRRGAPWTFDAVAIVDLIRRCRSNNRGDIYAPTFDHATKDPLENGLHIPASVAILLFEGNYLLVDEQPWCEIKSIVDSCWLVTVNEEVARQRVARRHVAAGIESDMASALARVDRNDILNGRYILEHSTVAADITFETINEPGGVKS